MKTDMAVLVVDDFSTMRRIIRNLLTDLGFTYIYEAEDGLEAIEVLESNEIDFIITDWHMPNMDGLELVTHLRADHRTSATPILMVTAETKREQITRAAYAGVNGYIVKPFSAEVLQDKIMRIVTRLDK